MYKHENLTPSTLESPRIPYVSTRAKGIYANILLDYWFKRTFAELPFSERLLILLLQELIPERKIAAHCILQQMPQGQDDFSFPPVYFIGIMDFALHNMQFLEERPDALRQEIFDLLFEAAEIATFTPEDKVKYEFEMTTERDIRNQIAFAKKNARAEGKTEGKAEGKSEGLLERSIETARKMLSKGYPVEEIVEISELPIEQVLALQEEA